MIPTKEKNHFLENYRPFCRVCASNSLAQHCIIKKPVSRAGAFYFCKACEALSFHAESDAYAYGDDYYGCGNSKVGGLAHAIRCLSANWRADFVSKLVGKGHCLDIGCGDGEFLKAMYSRGWSIKGTELPGSACERAKKKLPGQIVCAAQFESAADPGSCNLITMWQVFEHLENPRQVLERCRNLLSDGGVLGIGVPNPISWQALWGKVDWLHFDPPRHLHLENLQTLVREAESLGFTCIAVRYPWLEFGPIGWTQTLMNKLGFSRDYFFEKMKDRWAQTSILSQILWTLLAIVLALPAFFLAFLESLNKRSATYEVYLRRGFSKKS
jgi:2-polyprenyl-3-methyl-5-hydroxy-6-metoxy-1,4-benzoquinol methylase